MIPACQTTNISATDKIVAAEIKRLCDEGWKHVRLSRKDTQETIDQVIPNNRARKEFCK